MIKALKVVSGQFEWLLSLGHHLSRKKHSLRIFKFFCSIFCSGNKRICNQMAVLNADYRFKIQIVGKMVQSQMFSSSSYFYPENILKISTSTSMPSNGTTSACRWQHRSQLRAKRPSHFEFNILELDVPSF